MIGTTVVPHEGVKPLATTARKPKGITRPTPPRHRAFDDEYGELVDESLGTLPGDDAHSRAPVCPPTSTASDDGAITDKPAANECTDATKPNVSCECNGAVDPREDMVDTDSDDGYDLEVNQSNIRSALFIANGASSNEEMSTATPRCGV